MEIHQRQRLRELNDLYMQHESTIDRLQDALRREIPLLMQELELSLEQTTAIDDYLHDRGWLLSWNDIYREWANISTDDLLVVTLFRYLRKHSFSLPHTLSFVLDTIKWRVSEKVDSLSLSTIDHVFFECPFCFFYHHDQCDRPILIIQLSHLPYPTTSDSSSMAEFLKPFVMFVLETTRLYTLDLTRRRIAEGVPNPVITDIMVLVDFKSAKSLPKVCDTRGKGKRGWGWHVNFFLQDTALVQAFIQLVRRYPSVAGTICLLNFGWMYQGMWQMVKLLLSEEAKNRICFPKIRDIASLVGQKDLIEGMHFTRKRLCKSNLFPEKLMLLFRFCEGLESTAPLPWNLTEEDIFVRYGHDNIAPPTLSRRNSSSSVNTVYYDVVSRSPSTTHLSAYLHMMPCEADSNLRRASLSSSSCYATPVGSMTPVSSHGNLARLAKSYSPLRIRATIRALIQQHGGISSGVLSEKLTVLQLQQQEEDEDQLIFTSKHDRSRRRPITNVVLRMLIKAEYLLKLIVIRAAKKAMKYRNMLYWLVACVLLRSNVQEILKSLMGEWLIAAKGVRGLLDLTTAQMGQLAL